MPTIKNIVVALSCSLALSLLREIRIVLIWACVLLAAIAVFFPNGIHNFIVAEATAIMLVAIVLLLEERTAKAVLSRRNATDTQGDVAE